MFDKAILERQPKPTAKAVSDMLLNEAHILTKLRHPRVLAILRPAQDTKKAIIFETEPIFASLANILRDYTNIKPSHALESFQLEPLEIKIGILQIAEGLDFLHHNANLIHRNLCPSSIYLTRKVRAYFSIQWILYSISQKKKKRANGKYVDSIFLLFRVTNPELGTELL